MGSDFQLQKKNMKIYFELINLDVFCAPGYCRYLVLFKFLMLGEQVSSFLQTQAQAPVSQASGRRNRQKVISVIASSHFPVIFSILCTGNMDDVTQHFKIVMNKQHTDTGDK